MTDPSAQQPLDQQERLALCDTFLEVGPDAPTLCEGWSTADLAAHLVIREHDPRSAPGIMFGSRFEGFTEKLMAGQRAKGYETMVERIRSGPPLFPWRIPKLRTVLNLQEYFVHHEDVRRANGGKRRTDVDHIEEGIWQLLKRMAGLQLRRVSGIGVELARPDGEVLAARKGSPVARLTGHPGELVLYLVGRKSHAEVEITGPADAVARVEQAQLRI